MGIPKNGFWSVFLSQIVKHKHPNFEEWSSAQCWRWYCSRLQISDGFKLWVWAFEFSIIMIHLYFQFSCFIILRFILIFASPISDSTSTRSVTIVANILRVERTGFHKNFSSFSLADVPSSTLSLGSSLNASNIKEGM